MSKRVTRPKLWPDDAGVGHQPVAALPVVHERADVADPGEGQALEGGIGDRDRHGGAAGGRQAGVDGAQDDDRVGGPGVVERGQRLQRRLRGERAVPEAVGDEQDVAAVGLSGRRPCRR